jgi:hypothetical protein
MSSYFCAHCGQRSGMMGHYRTELHPDTSPLEFCPNTVGITERGPYVGKRRGFVCSKGHTCKVDEEAKRSIRNIASMAAEEVIKELGLYRGFRQTLDGMDEDTKNDFAAGLTERITEVFERLGD